MPLTDEVKTRLRNLYAGRHKMFLLDDHPGACAALEKSGKLESYLAEIGFQAMTMHERIKDEMLAKAREIADPVERTNYENSITRTVEEFVNHDIVYVKL
jgi:hypothetical protein